MFEEIANVESFKYFMKILKQDNGYDNKLFYFDHKQKDKIIKNVKPLFNDNPNICSVKIELQGYGLGIKIWYVESYSYKSKSKKYKDQILYRNRNIYIPINSNYDKRKYKNFVNYTSSLINDKNTFKGLTISISHFSYGYVSKSSYNKNIVYPCGNKTKTLMITKDNIYIKIKDNNGGKIKFFPVTCNYLISELNLLQKEHRQQMINLIFDFLGEDNYLLKDVKRYYLKDLYFLAPIKIHQLVKYHNFNEMFSNEYKNTYNINFNTNDINFNYILLKIYEMIDKKDINKFIDDFKKKFAENRDRFLYPHYNFTKKYELAYTIINFIYFNHSECCENQNYVNYLYDYIMLCKQNKTKINIKRIKNIKKLHDEEMEKQMKLKEMDIKKKKKNVFIFDNNNIYKTLIDNMPAKYTLIDNEFDLYKESEIQHNCVYSYKDKILNSKCIIYKYEKNEKKHFTIEINYRYKTYRLKQIKNTYNQEPEPEDIEEVNNDIYLINKKLKKRA